MMLPLCVKHNSRGWDTVVIKDNALTLREFVILWRYEENRYVKKRKNTN